MPFLLILAILSLLILIPISFILVAKKKSAIPLAAISHPLTSAPPIPIDFQKLPSLFQQMITDIEHLYQQIEEKHQQNSIHLESWHTVHRLFFTRLPEIVSDYQSLEPHYATAHIMDITQNLTSYDLVHQQLKSILNFFHQINQSSNQQYLQNILTNQRYLKTVLDDTTIANPTICDTLPTFGMPNFDTLNATKNDVDYEIGLQYLATYLTEPTRLPTDFVQTIGQFSYFASITQLAVQDQLGHALAKLNLTADLQLEAVQDIVHIQIPQFFSQYTLEKIDLKKLKITLENLTHLLKQMLLTLDKPLPLADKLAFLQNLHDDVAMGFKVNDFLKV